MEIIILIFFAAYMGWIIFAHIEYWQNLKSHAPKEYEKLDRFKFNSVGGFPWVEHALTRKYKSIDIQELTIAGDRLCKAYDSVGKLLGFLVTGIVIGGFLYAIWFIIKNVN